MKIYRPLLVVNLMLLAGPASARQEPAKRTDIVCRGPFARDSGFATLQQAFGTANVTTAEVDGAEGEKAIVTVLYAKDKSRRIEIRWRDDKARQGIVTISIANQARWRTAGAHIGSILTEVETLNGKPFTLAGFDWDYGGTVLDWRGGKLAALPGGCRLGLRFEADRQAPAGARTKVVGDKEFSSADPSMRASRPRVYEIYLSYPDDTADEPAKTK
jgi:hypothetical protein